MYLRTPLLVTDTMYLRTPLLVTDTMYLRTPLLVTDTMYLRTPLLVTDTMYLRTPLLVTDTMYLRKPLLVTDTMYHRTPLLVTDTMYLRTPLLVLDTMYHRTPMLVTDTYLAVQLQNHIRKMKTLLVLTTLGIVGHWLLEDILGNVPENKRSVLSRRSYENTLNFVFLMADDNRNGLLSAQELVQVTKPKDGSKPIDKARETVRLCDTNNDGELSKKGN
ncbi:unnamed protein product [Mytilus coruscus]|uniref:EF-hand domain-containing protein n=1 Tax=Mytilus coruscus TaxID=42192 RepID=A0A6J8DKU6_MYTCO|nr:unnamed protein product [Mytilus coruscus]